MNKEISFLIFICVLWFFLLKKCIKRLMFNILNYIFILTFHTSLFTNTCTRFNIFSNSIYILFFFVKFNTFSTSLISGTGTGFFNWLFFIFIIFWLFFIIFYFNIIFTHTPSTSLIRTTCTCFFKFYFLIFITLLFLFFICK